MAKKNWQAKLQALDGAVMHDYNPFANVVRWSSPSLNFIFGNTWGLPRGYSTVLFGPPKAGKTVLLNDMTAQIHRDDDEGQVIKFDTEFREEGQLTPARMKLIGIDPTRYTAYSVNSPVQIFDRIEKDIAEMCQDGFPLRAIYIDSLNGIMGRRMGDAASIDKVQIGDLALTLQDGLKRILEFQRKFRVSIVATAQVRAEMDQTEQMRGNKFRMAVANATQHWAEYFAFVEPLLNKESRTTLLGEKFEDETVTDLNGKAEQFAHKLRITMKNSSVGPKGRVGVLTMHDDRGIINTHEEVYLLGVNRGIIERPNNRTHTFGDKSWGSKEAMLEALRDPDLAGAVLAECRARDIAGKFDAQDAQDASLIRQELGL